MSVQKTTAKATPKVMQKTVQNSNQRILKPQKRFFFLPVQDFTEELGYRVSVARRKLHLSQSELAQKSQTSLSTYKRIEQGDMTVSIGTILSVLYCLDELKSCEGILQDALTEGDKPLPRRIRAHH